MVLFKVISAAIAFFMGLNIWQIFNENVWNNNETEIAIIYAVVGIFFGVVAVKL